MSLIIFTNCRMTSNNRRAAKLKGQFLKEEMMTHNVVITLSCGTNNTNRSTRAIHLEQISENNPSYIQTAMLLCGGDQLNCVSFVCVQIKK